MFYRFFCTTTPSRGSPSKSRYLEVQLVKEPLEGVVVQKIYKTPIEAFIWFNISNFFFRPVPVHPDPEIRFFGFRSVGHL